MNILQWKIGDRTFFSLEVDDRLLLVCSEGADYENTFFSSYPTADKFMFTFEFLKDVSDDMV